MRSMGRIAGVAALGAVLLVSCRTGMAPAEQGSAGARWRVLIAGESSGFKERVVAAAIEELGTREWYFRIVGLDQLKDQNLAQYGAILVVATMMGGSLGEPATRFLEVNAADPKVVLFFTRGGEGPIPEQWRLGPQADAVSSASRAEGVEGVARELAALLRAKF